MGKLRHTELLTHAPGLHSGCELAQLVLKVGEEQHDWQPCNFVVNALQGAGLYASPAHVNTKGVPQLLLVLTCMAASSKKPHNVARSRPPERDTVTPAIG